MCRGGGLDERGLLEWHGGGVSWVMHGNTDTELL